MLLAEDVKVCVLATHLAQELSLISVYSPARASLVQRYHIPGADEFWQGTGPI